MRLSAFLLPEVIKMTCTDDLHLEELGEKKVALFCCIPDSEKSLNYLVGLMYGQPLPQTILWLSLTICPILYFPSFAQ